MKGIKLTNVEGFLKKSDPFFELSCKRDAAGGLTWYVLLSMCIYATTTLQKNDD